MDKLRTHYVQLQGMRYRMSPLGLVGAGEIAALADTQEVKDLRAWEEEVGALLVRQL